MRTDLETLRLGVEELGFPKPFMVLDEGVPRRAGSGEPCVHFCEVALGAEASRRGYATGERMGASGRIAWPDTTGALPMSWYAAHPETWAAMTEEQRQCFVLKSLEGKGVACD
jgi:hypothetical protein